MPISRRACIGLAAAALVVLAGAALWRESGRLLLLAGAAAWAANWWVTRVEEPDLRRRFGAAYEAYLRNVPRWLPHRRRGPT